MRRLSALFVSLCLAFSLMANDDSDYLPGKVVIKIRKEFFSESARSVGKLGVPALESSLNRIGIANISPRFQLNDKRSLDHDIRRLYLLEFDPARSPLAVINALNRDPAIEYAEPIYIRQTLALPNDPLYSPDYFTSMQAPAAWDIHKGELGSQQTVIAIVDTGMNWKHPDLGPNVWNNLGEDANSNGYTMYHNGTTWVMDSGDLNGIDDDSNGKIDDLIGWDFMLDATGAQANDPLEGGGHGTYVSGLAGARTNNSAGVSSLSWNVTLMPISCTYPAQSSSIFNGYEAVIYAAENGADVINCSWGGTGYSAAEDDAIDYAYSLGSIIVAAAGNSNNQIPLYPAAYPKVIATASLMNNGTRWSGSNYGGYIDLGAPNEAVGSTSGSSYGTSTGATSYASPIASAMFALLKSYHPAWTQEQLINQVKGTCDDIDALNPGKENLLGEGKLNAYRALSETDPSVDQELRLALLEVGAPTDANANHAVEAGETFSLNLTLRNYAWGVSSPSAIFTLSTTSTYAVINSNSLTHSIPADDLFQLTDAFSVTILPGTMSRYISFTLSVVADLPIVNGASLTFQVLVQNGGIFVWEGTASARDMSGSYIKTVLQADSRWVVYGTTFPASFYSFEAVFLSFGQPGSQIRRFDSLLMYNAVKEYLEAGGKLYIEGGDVVGFDLGYYLTDVQGSLDANEVLWPLLGIQSGEDGSTNVIDGLSGVANLPTQGMGFSSSLQTNNTYIDKFQPLAPYGMTALIESNYGNVGIISLGQYGQRTFVFSYAVEELVDATLPSTRANLILQIMDFFDSTELSIPLEPDILSLPGTPHPETRLSWSPVLGATYYKVFRSSDPTGGWIQIGWTQSTSYNLTELDPLGFFHIVAATGALP
ncbi:MAG TPA: S8 family serine peptidase [Candidatus Cloacimonadota bacterium]|nr:S8 family serine peptidase [Candidatus Cloacimonadota bacterium]